MCTLRTLGNVEIGILRYGDIADVEGLQLGGYDGDVDMCDVGYVDRGDALYGGRGIVGAMR